MLTARGFARGGAANRGWRETAWSGAPRLAASRRVGSWPGRGVFGSFQGSRVGRRIGARPCGYDDEQTQCNPGSLQRTAHRRCKAVRSRAHSRRELRSPGVGGGSWPGPGPEELRPLRRRSPPRWRRTAAPVAKAEMNPANSENARIGEVESGDGGGGGGFQRSARENGRRGG